MGLMEDDQLWEAIQAGEPAAFADLFERHGDFVYNFAFRRTASWDAADEIVSVVFLEAWRQRATVVTRHGSLRPWLVGVAHNQVRRWWRGRQRLRRAVDRLSVVAHSDDHAAAVASRVDDERQMASVLAVVDRLSDAHREVLLLWAWEGFSYDEIATALGISVGTVRSRLSRARANLAQLDGASDAQEAEAAEGTAGRLRAFIGDTSTEGCRDQLGIADRGGAR